MIVPHAARAQMPRIMLQKQHAGINALTAAAILREAARLAVEPTALLAAEIKMLKMQLQNLVAASNHPGEAAKSRADAER
jgi:hypothetical protein